MDVASKYFDFEKLENYLSANLHGVSLSIHERGSEEQLTVSEPQDSSFQLSEIDLLGNVSFTSGRYKNRRNGVMGVWEEFRLSVKKPRHFRNAYSLEPGKYRVRVQDEEGWEKPVVKTFIRGFCRWKENRFTNSIPLTEIIAGELNAYRINP